MAFNILEAVLSSGWGCASLDREAWKSPKYSAEERVRGGGFEGERKGTTASAGLRRDLERRQTTWGIFKEVAQFHFCSSL